MTRYGDCIRRVQTPKMKTTMTDAKMSKKRGETVRLSSHDPGGYRRRESRDSDSRRISPFVSAAIWLGWSASAGGVMEHARKFLAGLELVICQFTGHDYASSQTTSRVLYR